MKRAAAFLRTTLLGGLVVVLPVVVVCRIAAKTVLATRTAAQSLVEKLTGHGAEGVHFPMIFAVLIVIALSFLIGLAMTSDWGRRCGGWIERALLFRILGYAAVRAIVGGLANVHHEGAVRPGLLSLSGDAECFVVVTEDHGDGRLTVSIPGSPNPSGGIVQIVPKDKVRVLNVRITDIASALQQWGVGAHSVLAKHAAAPSLPAKK